MTILNSAAMILLIGTVSACSLLFQDSASAELDGGLDASRDASQDIDSGSRPDADDNIEMILTPITTGADDAFETLTDGAVNLAGLNGVSVELGKFLSGDSTPIRTIAGFRFADLAIPKDATIVSAVISFKAARPSDDALSLNISMQDEVDPLPFAVGGKNISNRPKVIATEVKWELSAWKPGVDQRIQTPSLHELLQLLVVKENWPETGAAVVFIFEGDSERSVTSFEGDPNSAARLQVRFIPLQ